MVFENFDIDFEICYISFKTSHTPPGHLLKLITFFIILTLTLVSGNYSSAY